MMAERPTPRTRPDSTAPRGAGPPASADPLSRVSQSPTITSGKSSEERVQRKHRGKLDRVKRVLVAVAIGADLILIGALVVQLLTLDATLGQFVTRKTANVLSMYRFQYDERFRFAALGATLYQNASDTDSVCRALGGGEPDAIAEVRRQLMGEQMLRTSEIIVLLDGDATIVTASGPESVTGLPFDPDNVVTHYASHYAATGRQLMASVMLDRRYFDLVQSPEFGVPGDYRPDLPSWKDMDQALTRVVLTPVRCADANVTGFLLIGDSIMPRQYDFFATVLTSTQSAMGAILSRNTDTGLWQTSFSYNQVGDVGAADPFPDLLRSAFRKSDLDLVAASAPDTVFNGDFVYGGVPYRYAMSAVMADRIGDAPDPYRASRTAVVYVYAEPIVDVQQTVRTAALWQSCWVAGIVVLSATSIAIIFRKFIQPMKALVESVKRKRMKEFNDGIRRLKANRAAIWILLVKMVTIEALLALMLFISQQWLSGVAPIFSSARTEGAMMSYAYTHNSYNQLQYLASWAMQRNTIRSVNASHPDLLCATLDRIRTHLDADMISVISLDSEVLASSYRPSVGRVFPETGLIRFLRTQSSTAAQVPFLAHAVLEPETVAQSSPGLRHGPRDVPVLVQYVVAPIRHVSFARQSLFETLLSAAEPPYWTFFLL